MTGDDSQHQQQQQLQQPVEEKITVDTDDVQGLYTTARLSSVSVANSVHSGTSNTNSATVLPAGQSVALTLDMRAMSFALTQGKYL
jgi:hypothetical protein